MRTIMFHRQRETRVFLAAALLAVANRCPASAGDDGSFYAARYEVETSSGIARSSETLDVKRHDATTSFVSVSSPNGALVTLPTKFAADGEILSNASDPSVTCYNMAAAALYANERAPTQPAAIFIRFGDNAVAVPLALKATETRAGLRVLAGSGATAFTLSNDSGRIEGGMIVDARIDVASDGFSKVVFNEATLLGSPARPVSRITCSLEKAAGPAPAAGVPAAPVLPALVLPG